MATRDFIMGATVPTLAFDPFFTLEIVLYLWLGVGMTFATIGLLSSAKARHTKSTSVLIAAWCIVSITAPAVFIWRMVRPRD